MKDNAKFTIGILLITVLLFITGCTQLDKAYTQKPVPASTNAVTGVVTPAHVELSDKPLVTGPIELVGSLPIPWAGTAAAVIGGLYALYRNIRNKNALVATVQGVEAFRRTMQTPDMKPLDDKLKKFLIEHQELGGVLDVVSKVVNDKTVDTTPSK